MTEIHISSLVLHSQSRYITQLEHEIAQHPYSELGAVDADQGKLIVILETPSMRELKESISYFEQLEGVLTAAMVYHHVEEPSSLSEVIS